jgi:hypothetical protein
MNRFTYPIVALALAAGACGSGSDSTTTPTTPTPTVVSIEFQGTLTQNGAATFPFAVLASGQVTATIVSLAPDSSVIVGLGVGVWDGTACQATPGIWDDKATQGTAVVGNVTAAASLCVRIYDSRGDLPQPTDYDVKVDHP